MERYYQVDPSTSARDTSGRYPSNHVRFSPALRAAGWLGDCKEAISGERSFVLTKRLLREFDKPGPLHPRWGSEAEVGVLRECLELFCDGIDQNPHISTVGRILLKTIYIAHLKNRTAVIAHYDANADFIEKNGSYTKPLIVTGFPRTGTTLLHRLLAEDPQSRSPFTFEMEQALPPLKTGDAPERDPRIRKSNASMGIMRRLAPGFIEKFNESHFWSATEKEESLVYMQFHNGLTTVSHFQAGRDYVMRMVEPDVAPALFKYEYNFFTMLDAFAPARSHWINKAPSYSHYFAGIFEQYDDARVVLTHRNPAKNAASAARLLESVCVAFDKEGHFDKYKFAKLSTEYWGLTWTRPMAFRRENPDREAQIIDAVYSETFADPIGMVRKIYRHFEMDLTPEFEERMAAYLSNNQQGKHGRHRYSNEEYGIDADALRNQYLAYFEHYGFGSEPAPKD